jgi:hypothetical protein
MKQVLILAGFLIISSSCFAIDYYAEYSFNETDKMNIGEYSFVFHWTKAEMQAAIDENSYISDYIRQILRAKADKRIFTVDRFVDGVPRPYKEWGWLFIKINENEYLVFFTGL